MSIEKYKRTMVFKHTFSFVRESRIFNHHPHPSAPPFTLKRVVSWGQFFSFFKYHKTKETKQNETKKKKQKEKKEKGEENKIQ